MPCHERTATQSRSRSHEGPGSRKSAVRRLTRSGAPAPPELCVTRGNAFLFRSGSAIVPVMQVLTPRKIIHVDMDAFYASVEQRDDVSLKGRPVAVGYAAKRGVVAAASYEARAFGVRSAMPATTALRQCPGLVFVAPRFELYRAVSRQIHAIFAEYTELIEPLSLDEAYLDVSGNRRRLPTAGPLPKTSAPKRARENEHDATC